MSGGPLDSGDEVVVLVDDTDRVVGAATRRAMRNRRLLHRATYVLVFDSAGRLYVQRRTTTKDVYPGYLDPAAGGVVLVGESYLDSARRELAEELGIRGVSLSAHGAFRFEDPASRVWGRVFSCVWEGPLVLQAEEVAEVIRMAPAAVLASPEPVTPDGREALRRYLADAGTA